MAKFDVHLASDGAMLLDCQSDLLKHLSTRLVVPLVSPDDGVVVERRLTPILDIGGNEMLTLTHFAAAVPVSALGRRIASATGQEYIVANALDMLISGY
jgi:toxin CcdB